MAIFHQLRTGSALLDAIAGLIGLYFMTMWSSASSRIALGVTSLMMLLMTVAFAAGPSSGTLKGNIADSVDHAPISPAFVLVHKHGLESGGQRLAVDGKGSFSAELSPGFYDVFVSSGGFSPACGQVEVEAGKTAEWNAELRMSRLVNTPD